MSKKIDIKFITIFKLIFMKLKIEWLSKRDNHKILSVAQQEMKLVSDLESLLKYGLLDG